MNNQTPFNRRKNQTSPNDFHIQNLIHFKQINEPAAKRQKIKKSDINVIKHTRKMISSMTQKQRFKKAKNHFYDALYNRRPMLQTFSELPENWVTTFQMIQATKAYSVLLYLLAFLYMYLVIPDQHKNFTPIVITQGILLVIFWVDILLSNYRQVNQKIRLITKMQNGFYFKIVVFIALLVDFSIFLCTYRENSRVIRIFRVLRGFLPIFYDSITRKNCYALMAAAKDIFVFLIFYALILFIFAQLGNQFISIPKGVKYDQYRQNYGYLGKFIFIFYIMSSYDAYPQNQLLAIKYQYNIYVLFIVFIFLNVFVFVNIPTTIIYKSFKDTRSKIILIDQLKQQHSLILAFVSLGQENLNLKNEKLIRFLLYLYKNKTEYLNEITEICLKLDQSNSGFIQVSEFMQISKIMQQKQSMIPPSFYDWQQWIKFRKYLNKKINLKQNFKDWKLQSIIAGIIFLASANNFAYIYTQLQVLRIINIVFTFVYLAQIALKIIAFGFQQFFADIWNTLDFYIVVISTVLTILCFFPDVKIPHNSEFLIKMFRIYRASFFLQCCLQKQNKKYQNTIWRKVKQLFQQTTIIIPIIVRFFSLIIIFYYILGIIGMEAFYTIYDMPASSSPYSSYDEFSNFRTFIGSQIVMVQVLVQAGWSTVAFDHAYRSEGFYGPVMIYFVFCHVVIVIILASLFKGIVWEVYFAVDGQYKNHLVNQIAVYKESQKMLVKKRQYEQINEKVNRKEPIFPTTIVKRQMIENKIDFLIFKKLKIAYQKYTSTSLRQIDNKDINRDKSKDRIMLMSNLMKQKEIQLKDFREADDDQSEAELLGLYEKIMANNVRYFSDLQFVEQVDFQQKMQNILSKIILNPKIQYSQTMVYPKLFIQFLASRCQKTRIKTSPVEFNQSKHILMSPLSMRFHTKQLNSLLEINMSTRLQKLRIAEHMVNQGLLTQQQVKKQFEKKYKQDSYNIEVNHILRKVFLHDTNEDLVQKFQLQYFSNIYGQKFRQINKVRLQPLLKYESMLMYNFRNVLRYEQVQCNDFFQILSTIENSCSNKLLKKGSLFKFVYQLDSLNDTWFTIEYSHQKEVIVHFIKSGIWVYNKYQQQNQIYHGKDIFNWDLSNSSQSRSCQQFMKLFFQSFETIALSGVDQKSFFQTDPEETVYDLFFFFIDTALRGKQKEKSNRKLKISKIMLVILSKQYQRQYGEELPYSLTDINQQIQTQRQHFSFSMDEGQHQTFEKLKNMTVLDQQKIKQSDGLPYAYIVNLMTQIQQTLQIHSGTMVNQVETILNETFDQVFQEGNMKQSQRNLTPFKKRLSKRISSQFLP